METPNLPALLADLEAATGPSREMFIRVLRELFPNPEWEEPWIAHMADLVDAKAWTDAALVIVEKVLPGCSWTIWFSTEPYIDTGDPAGARARLCHDDFYIFAEFALFESDVHPTPALALLIALLRAQVARQASEAHPEKESSHAG